MRNYNSKRERRGKKDFYPRQHNWTIHKGAMCQSVSRSVSKDYELEIIAPCFSPSGRLLEICLKVVLFYNNVFSKVTVNVNIWYLFNEY